MDFRELLTYRQSVRSFTDKPVDKEQIARLIEAAQHAPVGMHNNKGYLITVITNPAVIALMKKTYQDMRCVKNDPAYGAPLFILISQTAEALPELVKYDAGCLIENMHLAAANEGLGSVYIHGMIFTIRQDKRWQKAAGLPDGVTPVCGLAVGHSKTPVRPRETKEVFAVSYAE